MKIVFLVILIVLITTVSQANTIFYDPVTKQEILDVSDKKTKEIIIRDFGVSEQVEEIKLGKTEHYRIKNDKIEKYDYVFENEQLARQEKDKKDQKAKKFKTKLGLTDQEWEELKEVLK